MNKKIDTKMETGRRYAETFIMLWVIMGAKNLSSCSGPAVKRTHELLCVENSVCLHLHRNTNPKAQNNPKALYSMVFGPKSLTL